MDATFISAAFQPDDAVLVKIWFIEPFRHRQDNDNTVVIDCHVFRVDCERAANMLAGAIADQLVDTGHSPPGKTRN